MYLWYLIVVKAILHYTETPKKSSGSVDEVLQQFVSNTKVTSLVKLNIAKHISIEYVHGFSLLLHLLQLMWMGFSAVMNCSRDQLKTKPLGCFQTLACILGAQQMQNCTFCTPVQKEAEGVEFQWPPSHNQDIKCKEIRKIRQQQLGWVVSGAGRHTPHCLHVTVSKQYSWSDSWLQLKNNVLKHWRRKMGYAHSLVIRNNWIMCYNM